MNVNIHIPLFYLQFGCKHVQVGPMRLRFRKAALQGVELIAYGSVFLGIDGHDQQRVFNGIHGTLNISHVSSLWLDSTNITVGPTTRLVEHMMSP